MDFYIPSAISGALTGFIILVFFIIFSQRSNKRVLKHKPKNIITLETSYPIPGARQCIKNYAQKKGLAIEEKEGDTLVLSQGMSLLHWGFWYPIYFEEQNGKTVIEIGIKGKVGDFNLFLKKYHRKITDEILEELQK